MAAQRQQGFVFDDPVDGFTASELHGSSDRRREIDIPLLAGFALDELDLGGESHISSYITRWMKKLIKKQNRVKMSQTPHPDD